MTTMSRCSRDDCPPANIKTELTTKCSNCKCVIHLPCIGINVKAIEISSPNIRILCQKCVTETSNGTQPVDLNTSFNVKSTPKENRTTIKQIMNEMKLLRNCVEENGKKIEKIDQQTNAIHRTTEVLVDKATRPTLFQRSELQVKSPKPKTNQMKQSQGSLIDLSTPSTPKSSALSFANVVRKNQSAKRQRIEKSTKKVNVPEAKTGTKSGPCALSVPPKKRDDKPKFEKAVWVSRFIPTVTCEEVTELVMANTSIKQGDRIKVHKLVKKDRDISTLKFVSFKIESNDEDFEVLKNPNVWPETIMVRPFLKDLTLGDFMFPALNTNVNRKVAIEEKITANMKSPVENAHSPKKTPPKTSSPITMSPEMK